MCSLLMLVRLGGEEEGLTIITTCSIPLARASSPHFFQYVADCDSSPSIIVEPWEKKCTGVRGVCGAML